MGIAAGIGFDGEFLIKWPASSQSQLEAKGHKTYCFQSIIDHNMKVGVNANVLAAGRYIVITAD